VATSNRSAPLAGVQGYVLLVKVVLAAHRAPVVLAATVSSLADEK
jgi:hypothetical protein